MKEPSESEMITYRRRMPHWRLEGSVYFITWRLQQFQVDLSSDEREVIVSALQHFADSRYELYAYVVMHDHVHVMVKPFQKYRLQDIVHSWKSFTAHKFRRVSGRKPPIWQEEYFDRIIRDEKEFIDKAQYILNNPLKIWPEQEGYPWVWIKENFLP